MWHSFLILKMVINHHFANQSSIEYETVIYFVKLAAHILHSPVFWMRHSTSSVHNFHFNNNNIYWLQWKLTFNVDYRGIKEWFLVYWENHYLVQLSCLCGTEWHWVLSLISHHGLKTCVTFSELDCLFQRLCKNMCYLLLIRNNKLSQKRLNI